jgi:hypothetical protein
MRISALIIKLYQAWCKTPGARVVFYNTIKHQSREP